MGARQEGEAQRIGVPSREEFFVETMNCEGCRKEDNCHFHHYSKSVSESERAREA